MSTPILLRSAPPADRRVAYGPAEQQFAELRLPEGAGPFPVVVVLHGGYWRARYDLVYCGHLAAALTVRGIATWNVEYRRVGQPGGGWPETLLDVGRAVDALRTLATTAALDLTRVVAVGHSAGGQLALWAAARPRLPSTSPLFVPRPLPLRGVLSLAGVVDLRAAWRLHLSEGAAGALLDGAPEQVPDRYAAASPAELLPLGVPQILAHGTADEDVPFYLSAEYVRRAVALGDPARLLDLPGTDHFALVDPQSRVWPRILAAVEALLG